MYNRALDIRETLNERSIFLFGPRQTGKTTLLHTEFKDACFFNLAEMDTFRELSANPEMLRQWLSLQPDGVVVIDEVQKLPVLLNEVQIVIDRNPAIRFVLTGSSARGLREHGVNLLGGRARQLHLFPLIAPELDFNHLDKRLASGGLPFIYDSPNPEQDLKSYVGMYLHEEIRAEGFVRRIETFSRFLDVAGLCNGQLLNFTEIGSDAQVPPRTVREHFQLLEDTLIGAMLPPFQETKKRKPIATSKFYFFDTGVARYLMRKSAPKRGGTDFGDALEHLIFCELRAWLSYKRINRPLSFWRTHSKFEVDFLVGNETAIEVKASELVAERHFKGLRALAEEVPLKHKIVVSLERRPRKLDDGILVLPVDYFLRELWAGAYTP